MIFFQKPALNALSIAVISILATGCGGNSSSDPENVSSPTTEGTNTAPTTAKAPDPSTLPSKEDVTTTKKVTVEGVKTISEEISTSKPSAASYVSSKADLAFYDNIDPSKLNEITLADGRTLVTLDDIDVGYAGFGGELADITTHQAGVLQVGAVQVGALQISPAEVVKLEKTSEYYIKVIEDSLKDKGANTNILVNQTTVNSQSAVMNVVLDVEFSTDTNTSKVRDIINQAVNRNQTLSGSVVQSGQKYRVNLAFWLNDSKVMLWAATYLSNSADSINTLYSDINNASGLTGNNSLGTEEVKETFKQNTSNASKGIDILWSIDASGSMGQEQTNLANGAEQFFSELSNAGVDYRLAVNTQGYDCTSLRTISNGTDSYIDNNTANAKDEWKSLSRPGTSDASTETGFYCFDQVDLSGFDRPQADNIVIFVSDEPENETVHGSTPRSASSSYDSQSFDAYKSKFLNSGSTFFSIAGTGSVVKPTHDSNVDLYANNDYNCSGQGGNAAGGAHFKEIAIASGGSYASICADASDWSVMFNQILKTATGLASSFTLNDVAISPSTTVKINGVDVPRDTNHKNGYDIIYSNGKASIVFYGDNVPKQSDSIEVGYSKTTDGTGVGTGTSETVVVTKEEKVLVEKEVVVIEKPKRTPIR